MQTGHDQPWYQSAQPRGRAPDSDHAGSRIAPGLASTTTGGRVLAAADFLGERRDWRSESGENTGGIERPARTGGCPARFFRVLHRELDPHLRWRHRGRRRACRAKAASTGRGPEGGDAMCVVSQQSGPVGRSLVMVLAGLLGCTAVLRSPPLYAANERILAAARACAELDWREKGGYERADSYREAVLCFKALYVRVAAGERSSEAFEKELAKRLDELEAAYNRGNQPDNELRSPQERLDGDPQSIRSRHKAKKVAGLQLHTAVDLLTANHPRSERTVRSPSRIR